MRFSSSALIADAALATIVASCTAADQDDHVDSGGVVSLHPVSGEPALVTLRTTDYRVRLTQPGERLAEFVAVWPDGTILWSPKREQNGVRCLGAEVPPERVLLAVDNLRGLLDDPALTMRSFTIPDSMFDEVVLFDGKRMSSIASCVHFWESNPMVVATDVGIVAVEDRDRDTLVRSRSAEFNQLLDTWTRCVTEVHELVPAEGRPTSFPKDGWWDSRTSRCRVIEYSK